MAAELNNFGMVDEQKIIRAQAIWRGALVRKYFRDIRAAYEEVVQELDNGEQVVMVEWKSCLMCKPRVSIGKRVITQKKIEHPHLNESVNSCARNSDGLNNANDDDAKNFIYDETQQTGMDECKKPNDVIYDENLDHHTLGNPENDFLEKTPKSRKALADIKDSPTLNDSPHVEGLHQEGIQDEDENNKENKSPFLNNAVQRHIVKELVPRGEITDVVKIHVDSDSENLTTSDAKETEENSDEDKENVTASDDRRSRESSGGAESDRNAESDNTDMEKADSETSDRRTRDVDRSKHLDMTLEVTRDADMTSFWGTEKSFVGTDSIVYPSDVGELQKLRSNVAMELLWVQQAISSRKNYLRLKKKMGSNQAAMC